MKVTEWRRVGTCHKCGLEMNFFNPKSGLIAIHKCLPDPKEVFCEDCQVWFDSPPLDVRLHQSHYGHHIIKARKI